MIDHAEMTLPRGENRLTKCYGVLGGLVQVPAARDSRWRVPHKDLVVLSGLRLQLAEVLMLHVPRQKARRLQVRNQYCRLRHRVIEPAHEGVDVEPSLLWA